jgi:hypothetical protein
MRPSYFGVAVQSGQHWTSSYYLGIGTLALAIGAAVRSRNRRVLWLSAAALLGFVLALGDHGFLLPALQSFLPPVREMRYPIKCITLSVLAVPLLASYAVPYSKPLLANQPSVSWNLLLWIALSLGLATSALLAFAFLRAPIAEAQSQLLSNAGFRLLVLTMLVALFWFAAPHAKVRNTSLATKSTASARLPWVWILLPLVLWLDLITHAPRQNPTVRRWAYAGGAVDDFLPNGPRPALGQSRAMVSPQADFEMQFSFNPDPSSHVLSRRAALSNNLNLLEAIPKINGTFSLYPKEEAEVLTLFYSSTNSIPERLADFLGVSQISARSNLFSWERRTTSLPLITSGQRPIFADPDQTRRALVSSSFDPTTQVYLPQAAHSMVGDCGGRAASIKPLMFEAHRIAFQTTAANPAIIVIAQSYYHWWKAYFDGVPIPIFRANHAFQSLRVPAGSHHVELRYEDRSFLVGSAISLLTLAASFVAWRASPRAPRPQCGQNRLQSNPTQGASLLHLESRQSLQSSP